MTTAPTAAQLAAAGWIKSSYSAANNECVEIADARSWVAVRDSKDLALPHFAVTAPAFAAFTTAVAAGKL